MRHLTALVGLLVASFIVAAAPASAAPELQWLVSSGSCGMWPAKESCRTTVWRSGPNGESPRYLHDGPRWARFPDWSSDGSRVLYHRESQAGLTPGEVSSAGDEVFSSAPDGSDARVLTPADDTIDAYPRWSPDNRRITWAQGLQDSFLGRGKPSRIKVMNADGSGQRDLLALRGLVLNPAWTGDGQRIAFTWVPEFGSGGSPYSQIVSTNLEGGDLQRLSGDDVNSHNVAFSPDGRWVALQSGADSLIVRALDSNQARAYSFRGPSFSWSPDSRSLVAYGSTPDHRGSATFKLDVNNPGAGLVPVPEPPGLGGWALADFVGSVEPAARPDRTAPVGLVGAGHPSRSGLRTASVRPFKASGRPARLRLRRASDLRFLTADRTGLRRVALGVVRRSGPVRWRTVRSIAALRRIRRDLRAGTQRLKLRTRDIRGNARTAAVAVTVRGG